jgi:8-oxo-dGTP diphosphatase
MKDMAENRQVVDLLAALQRSIEAAKQAGVTRAVEAQTGTRALSEADFGEALTPDGLAEDAWSKALHEVAELVQSAERPPLHRGDFGTRSAPQSWESMIDVSLNQVEYVAGFLFDPAGERVALVRKGKPAWQAGRLNGIGGKVEPGEPPAEAMRREFCEEAGLDLAGWDLFATVGGDWGRVWFYRLFVTSGTLAQVRTMEAEEIAVHDVASIRFGVDTLPNLGWLIPLARYRHDRYEPVHAEELPGA